MSPYPSSPFAAGINLQSKKHLAGEFSTFVTLISSAQVELQTMATYRSMSGFLVKLMLIMSVTAFCLPSVFAARTLLDRPNLPSIPPFQVPEFPNLPPLPTFPPLSDLLPHLPARPAPMSDSAQPSPAPHSNIPPPSPVSESAPIPDHAVSKSPSPAPATQSE
ncbi:hypothetical protein MPTK1_3g18530 [Marchantia polymorpha subsp. ruderalis]|uniref:Uncharacterized protein n=2 Tax=Marchantia polymorpha TaxID=3197 RepID=A0AAF6B283_MARPO|nr:hypothetical protein MARPO_0142s0040 [Marchantia polymorpha]BBN06117.1 hypothetical protein Mp_3g18530 [Marchantia polymorpha subsp. ruderalis]|eukprot:PTQ29413.1 hypothetical protein MARPO_0142s0040 [Marchantia polymorpha]